jgi:ABC-type Fe3+-hydroxamate transport system substrate-binding protein
MSTSKALPILVMSTLAFVGCKERADTTKTSTQTETRQVGTTSESTTETKVATSTGDTKTITNSYLGTVTEFKPGKSIEVMTGEKQMHPFALDGKDDVVTVDPATAVGSKVQLVEEKDEKGLRRITVTIAPAS